MSHISKLEIEHITHHIFKTDGPKFLKMIMAYLVEQSMNWEDGDRDVCFTIRRGAGYSSEEVQTAASEADHLFNQMGPVLWDMFSTLLFTGSPGYLDKDMFFRRDDVHYTLWFSKEGFSTSAQDVSVSKEIVEAKSVPAFS